MCIPHPCGGSPPDLVVVGEVQAVRYQPTGELTCGVVVRGCLLLTANPEPPVNPERFTDLERWACSMGVPGAGVRAGIFFPSTRSGSNGRTWPLH
jgi:hypothetical protein